MSETEIKIYNINDVNKKILAKPLHLHPEKEYLGVHNKYRDEDYKIYIEKQEQFYKAAGQYKQLNKNALLHNKNKLDMFSINILRYFSECECDTLPKNMRCSNEPNATGLLVRKRTIRPANKQTIKEMDICLLEPWFKRYLKLCKFIYAARTIILKNRLLKNLQILKQLDKETVAIYEKGHKKFENVSYASIFDKFIN
ncbi:hypothetical protein ILUMI_02944 [Ignelater luminosus]|uniref:Uncharacterized protein n=1 Tax=Ignelater luminosus TaxID=2038154 RepID=A0A8K0DBW9_IGNLU|nr:hypothetical protein ILUMI_02944 [Ignelater luminosus]